MVKDALSFLPPLSLGRPLLSRSRHLSFPSSRSPSAASSLCRRRTPASVPTLASQIASMAHRHAVGRRRWTSTATRCMSATILMRRYQLHGGLLLLGVGIQGRFPTMIQQSNISVSSAVSPQEALYPESHMQKKIHTNM